MWRKIIDDYRLEYRNDLFEIKLIFYGLSRMLQFSEFVWALSYSVSLYPLSFFANTPLNVVFVTIHRTGALCTELNSGNCKP